MLRLIASGAYIEQELAAEFGQIPPSFLPIGVTRLYESQVRLFDPGHTIHLTIPEGFTPQPYDRKRLNELGVTLVPVPLGLKLGESIVYAINIIGGSFSGIELLHGDTLIDDIPARNADLIAVHLEGDDYSWSVVDLNGGLVARLEAITAGTGHESNRPVACGYFVFSNITVLVRAITRARGDFIAGLNIYVKEVSTKGVHVERWRDFGHIQTYFRSRRAITTERAFNSLQIDNCSVRKSSADQAKIRAEAAWFESIPSSVRPYTARLLEVNDIDGMAFYRTEYRHAPTLAELFVFSSIGRPTWNRIGRSCQEFLESCAVHKGAGTSTTSLLELAASKTMARLERYARESGFDIDKSTVFGGRNLPSLRCIAEQTALGIDLRPGHVESVMHGDFCFSNILYDSRAGRISVIDPRGYVWEGTPSIFGDVTYDLAKLMHSVIGYYDHIIAGRYSLQRDGEYGFNIDFETNAHHGWLEQTIAELEVDGVCAGSDSVRAVTIGLFLSMLPLHADRPDRQIAFIANALRLYADLLGSKF